MEIEEIKRRLQGLISYSYTWPEVPAGWRLEFIVYSNTEVEMDLLHPVSASFWSDENDNLQTPIMANGQSLTAATLQAVGIPFMTPMLNAGKSNNPIEPHLKSVKNNRTD